MPNITQFAKTAPFDGEIRVFVSESIDGTKIVRALTVDNNAIGGKSVIPTLENLVRISMAVTASGEFSDFTPLSVSRKNTYFFVTMNPFIFIADNILFYKWFFSKSWRYYYCTNI